MLRLLVTATPAQRSVPLGGRIRIDGNVRPNRAGTRVILQRRRVDGWVPEATAIIRASGRYTIYATPPREGTFRYRVYNGGNRFLALLTGRSQEMLLIAN